MVELRACAGDGDGFLSAFAPLARRSFTAQSLFGGDVGAQGDHLQVVASVEGQLDDAAVLDDGSDSGGLGGQ